MEAPHPLALLGVIRAPGADVEWEAADPSLGVSLVRGDDLAALVRPAPSKAVDTHPDQVAAQHWEVHRALLQGDVVPAPLGIVFPSAEEVRGFLTESHASLTGAMERVAGKWEFRLHVDVVEQGFSRDLAMDLSTHIYAELRRVSAAAVTLAATGTRVLTAAFLVPRSTTGAFQERLDVLARLNSALELDLTGPWPPYDFVQMHG
ncbi:MAG TPA: GvpL/GvpF family gas vesicle protein [Longimicrobium sp.]|nr:GvpL/GvpF family gas vesicle protein [Longimicrobium sp.]